MRKVVFLVSALCIFGSTLGAATVLIPGTPNMSGGATGSPTGLTPKFGTLVSFDELTPNTLLAPATYAGVGVSSINAINSTVALSAVPFSGQSQPNYVGPADFSNIDINISLAQASTEIGVGLLAGSSNVFTLTARDAANAVLSAFTVTVPSNGVTAFNAYYAIQDTNSSIKSLEIAGNGGIDDLQFTTSAAVPEPATLAFCGCGFALVWGSLSFRRKN